MTREITFREAVCEAMAEEMRLDPQVILIGEDVGRSGGIFKCSEGLFDEFGPERVIDAPISEAGYIGVSVGAAMTGLRPIAELMFGDFSLLTMDQLVNQAAKIRYMTGGQCKVPLTVRLSMGAGRSSAAQHSQSLHALFSHIPGLKVVIPSCPADAKGLLKSAIRDDNPVLVFEDKMMYNDSGPVPEEEATVPPRPGQGPQVGGRHRPGGDLRAWSASPSRRPIPSPARGAGRGRRSPQPLSPRQGSSRRRGEENGLRGRRGRGAKRFGVTGELASVIQEHAFDWLDGPVIRVAAADVPVPFSPALEMPTIPGEALVVEAVRGLRGRGE